MKNLAKISSGWLAGVVLVAAVSVQAAPLREPRVTPIVVRDDVGEAQGVRRWKFRVRSQPKDKINYVLMIFNGPELMHTLHKIDIPAKKRVEDITIAIHEGENRKYYSFLRASGRTERVDAWTLKGCVPTYLDRPVLQKDGYFRLGRFKRSYPNGESDNLTLVMSISNADID